MDEIACSPLFGPSKHLSWKELACINRLGVPFRRSANRDWAPGEVISIYPMIWREDRACALARTFEAIRYELGAVPLTINSAYRTEDYNRAVNGVANSQHLHGRAIDMRHTVLRPRDLFAAILRLEAAGKVPLLGGVGGYQGFVHIDVRPRVGGHLARWVG